MLKDNRDAGDMSDRCWIKAIGRDEQGDGLAALTCVMGSSQKRGFVPDFHVVQTHNPNDTQPTFLCLPSPPSHVVLSLFCLCLCVSFRFDIYL